MENTEQLKSEYLRKNKVHKVLAASYLFCFISFLFGLMFDFIFPLKFFAGYNVELLGLLFLVIGTFLIVWAQKTSRSLKKENITKETFCHGPYHYMRSPTNLGLFLLTFGFGLILNALFVVIFSVLAFIVGKFVFIKKEEKILAEKYGAPYLEYKASVKF